ncbi:MAG: ADP-ribosylglycohydrolase family protein [Candidatus Dormiibacterota bacterium]
MELPTISDQELRSRASAVLLGMACGELAGGSLTLTRLALDLGESVVERGRVEAGTILERWVLLPPGAGPRPGSITGQALRLFQEGFPAEGLADATARLLPERSGDAPLVRALPLAILARRNGALLKSWADESALITHSDLTTRMATVGACLLARDLLTRGLEESLARVDQALREEAPLRLARTFRMPGRAESPELGDDAVAVLSQAIHALARTRDLDDVLQELENQERPNAGAQALGGGLAGAAFGFEPSSRRLGQIDEELRRRIDRLAQELVDFEARDHASGKATNGAAVHLPGLG